MDSPTMWRDQDGFFHPLVHRRNDYLRHSNPVIYVCKQPSFICNVKDRISSGSNGTQSYFVFPVD